MVRCAKSRSILYVASRLCAACGHAISYMPPLFDQNIALAASKPYVRAVPCTSRALLAMQYCTSITYPYILKISPLWSIPPLNISLMTLPSSIVLATMPSTCSGPTRPYQIPLPAKALLPKEGGM